jgi:hypothetical protein
MEQCPAGSGKREHPIGELQGEVVGIAGNARENKNRLVRSAQGKMRRPKPTNRDIRDAARQYVFDYLSLIHVWNGGKVILWS